MTSTPALVWCLAFLVMGGAVACEGREELRGEPPGEDLRATMQRASATNDAPNDTLRDECAERASLVQAGPRLPGTPHLDLVRAHLLARARNVPLVFARSPLSSEPPGEQDSSDAEVGPEGNALEDEESDFVQRQRARLWEGEFPISDIQEVLRLTRGRHDLRRRIFLSGQYLYAERPELALRLSQILRLDHLFREPKLEIRRGGQPLEAIREEGRYFLPPASTDGSVEHHPTRGGLASLLLFDQVKLPEESWQPLLGFDLRPLARELGFDAARVRFRGEQEWVLDITTRTVASTILVRPTVEGTFELSCESATDFEGLKRARAFNLLEQSLLDPILAAAHEMIARRLPFDEPRTEEGQQDGLLRLHFRQAYRRHRSTYEFNGDEYYVFDGFGRPRLPQVCIDFITDAFDWGTGGYWPPRGHGRVRVKGALHFAGIGIENPRSVESLLEFALATPEWFDVHQVPRERGVQFRRRERFFEHLAEDAARFRRGDIVFIYGLRDDGKFHYHSFMIDEKDPLTGMPLVVLANAGPPQARSWEGEMQNAPLRRIVARVRVKTDVLERAREQQKTAPGVPLQPPTPREGEDASDPGPAEVD